ncbi:MAG: phosphatase PAP2 family protein [Smithella sp.]
MQFLKDIDRRLLKWAYLRPYKNSFSVKALIFAGEAMSWMMVLFIAAVAGQLLDSKPLNELVISIILGSTMGIIVFLLCKGYVKRRRPYANDDLQKDLNVKIQNRDPLYASKALESFPSGHVLWTTICVSLICFQFGFIYVLLIGWLIPAMIYLRPHLGVHYPSDVIASLFTGLIIAAITLFIAPAVVQYTNSLRKYPVYTYGYWVFIIGYLIIAVKIWLKRI